MAPSVKAAGPGDSVEINKLLSDAKIEAIRLRDDAGLMESYSRSKATWESYTELAEMIRQHVNAADKFLMVLDATRPNGSAWQQTAIDRIDPLLRELATNSETLINELKEHGNRVHSTEFQDHVKAHAELASKLAALVTDFIDYGHTKDKVEHLSHKLEVTGS